MSRCRTFGYYTESGLVEYLYLVMLSKNIFLVALSKNLFDSVK